jgi:hypothetical protein
MTRLHPFAACVILAPGLTLGCGSSSGASGAGGPFPHGPSVGGLILEGKAAAKLSGNLQADGSLDITMHGSQNVQTHAQLAADSTFDVSSTVQGYAIRYSGNVALQPGAQHKFVISGTFAATYGTNSTTGTFDLRSLDWEVLDGIKAEVSSSGVTAGSALSMVFATDTLGFLAEQTSASSNTGQIEYTSTILRTDDAGTTWNRAGSLTGGVAAMAFADQRLWLSTGTGLWSSADQGLSFVPVIAQLEGLNNDYTGVSSRRIQLDFFDRDHGVLLDPDLARTWLTEDGGKTYHASPTLLADPYDPFGETGSVQMISATEAVALVPTSFSQAPALFRTSDAGVSWQIVNPSVTPVTRATADVTIYCSSTITGVRFADSKKGWAVGGQCLATTDDGGVTWTWTGSTECSGTSRLLQASTTRVFAGCDNGRLRVTGDGGATFNEVLGITGKEIGMRLLPDGTGLLAADGRLFTSGDNGATWNPSSDIDSGTTAISPISISEWWAWGSIGLEHVRQSGAVSELGALAVPLSTLRVTPDAVWVAASSSWSGSNSSKWLALPLAGGAPQVISAATNLWPLSRATLVAQTDEVPYAGAYPQPGTGLSLSVDGGRTWTPVDGLSSDNTNPWNGCVADPTHAWFEKQGSFYLLQNATAQVAFATEDGTSATQSLYCDADRFWFVDDGVPKVLSVGSVVSQVVPLEWDSGKADSLSESVMAASAFSDQAAWLLLPNGRLLRFMDDAAYGVYQGPAVLGTPPTSTSTGTNTGSNHSPTLQPIQGVARYNYDMDANYMGGTIELSTYAGDPDGDKVTITWTVEASSGGPALTNTTGNSTVLVMDSFSNGTVRATASDGKGGTDTQIFQFSPPPRP